MIGGGLGTSAATDEHAVASQLAGTAGWDRPPAEPDSRGDLALALINGILFGIAPALRLARVKETIALGGSGSRGTAAMFRR